MNAKIIAKIKKDLANVQTDSLERVTDADGKFLRYDFIKVGPTIIEREGKLIISGEDGRGFVDYYGEYRGGYPYINPDLEAAAKKHGCFWEWENPGCIYLND